MNALKHGLDARTLILPDENESDYRDRRSAWMAHYRPRDPLEAALVEQAVRLSWRLDRADRVCAQHLAERIRLLQSPEYQKQQAAAAAAEAARIGEQLIADPPPPRYNLAKIHARLVRLRQTEFAPFTPIFDLPFARAKLATKRFRMPIPPDDPGHPKLLLRRLKSTAAGCAWLLDRWGELRTALGQDNGWHPEERLRAVRLLAKQPADAVDDPTVRSIYFSCVILGGKDAQVYADQVREMADVEFRYFLERMAGRGLTGQAPPSQEEARERLLALVDDVLIGLQARAAVLADRGEAALSSDWLAFDGSPAGRRLVRLQSRLFGSLMRTLNRLTEARRRSDGVVTRPKPVENLAASPEGNSNCEKIRNEPNGPLPAGCGRWHAPSVLGGGDGVQMTGRVVAPSSDTATACEEIRNEPNADPPAATATQSSDAMANGPEGVVHVGWVQPTAPPGLSSVGCTHPTMSGSSSELGESTATSREGATDCDDRRNEPNTTVPRRNPPACDDRSGGASSEPETGFFRGSSRLRHLLLSGLIPTVLQSSGLDGRTDVTVPNGPPRPPARGPEGGGRTP